jgi:hypothetical protein
MSGVRLHRAQLPDRDIAMVRGAYVTTPIRTMLDVARSMPLLEAVAIGDSLCRAGLLTKPEVERAAELLGSGPGRPAAVKAAALLDGRAESVFESIPAAVPQLDIVGPDGVWIARVDFAWLRAKVALECDGFEFHSSREAFERDRRRWNALTRIGWRVVVVTWREVMGDPDYYTDLIGELVGTYS